MRDCKQLREISRLPQSVLNVDLGNCYSLNAQSSSRLLNQIGEILWILPNNILCKETGSKETRSKETRSWEVWSDIFQGGMSMRDSLDVFTLFDSPYKIRLPGTEIPKQLKLNHESEGNVISFWVGRKFPNIFFVCFAFGPLKYPRTSYCDVFVSINGCEKERLFSTRTEELSDNLSIVFFSNRSLQDQLNKSNPSERNYVEVICETTNSSDERLDIIDQWIKNHPRGWGVRVECICHWASNNGGGSRHQCEEETTTCPTLDGFKSDSDSGNGALVQPEFQLQRSCPGPLTEMEEIDPRAFNNGAEDLGLSIAHTYVNDGSNSMLYPPSKKARKS